ncbi:hypothetical protein NLX83_21880 [Allokutzneria sp. A3M-2-11 16]|uniref:GHMP family kinase ATP-binding protein n=1 Tax=Allokutzneria sp. A3M-2-11 16 TaxID=2962043 RepID=UPI0020B81013|nr:hypothetical protein [Allokutzneria sp. A3M-2-11 16]MCP3801921.1 hypothetical protein [Allokutzneria sp. A3M-2-11 16]
MIEVSAPMRLSLAGGGSDLPEHYERHGCRLLAVALTERVTVRVAAVPSRVTLRALGAVTSADSARELSDPLVRATLEHFGVTRGIDIAVDSGVKPGSGLGGSGAFLVALTTAVSAFTGRSLEPPTAARIAFHIERERCGRPVGQQDHWAAACGGAIELSIAKDGTAVARQVPELGRAIASMLDRELLLLRTPITRSAAVPLAAQAKALRGSSGMRQIQGLLDKFRAAFLATDIARIGALLHEHWTAKRAISSSMSTAEIDRWYELVREHGAYGAKLVGAGGGGHLLVATEAGGADRIVAGLAPEGLVRVPIGTSDNGVTVSHSQEFV